MIYERVVSFISTQFPIDEDDISEDTTFESLDADEEDMDELILTVEGEFEIKLHDNEIIRLCDIADLVAVIENALSLTDLDE